MKKTTNKKKLKNNVINKNYEAFVKILPQLIQLYYGKFALLRDEKIIKIFDTLPDAYETGKLLYNDGLFSVQEIKHNTATNLGFFASILHANVMFIATGKLLESNNHHIVLKQQRKNT